MTATDVCVHRWRLEPQEPMRREYQAECAKCGAARSYPGDPDEQIFRRIQEQPFGRHYSGHREDEG